VSDLQLTPYQHDALDRASWALVRIAAAAERFVEIAEGVAGGWCNFKPPRGDYKPENNPQDPTKL
jgi:hypothetical protein